MTLKLRAAARPVGPKRHWRRDCPPRPSLSPSILFLPFPLSLCNALRLRPARPPARPDRRATGRFLTADGPASAAAAAIAAMERHGASRVVQVAGCWLLSRLSEREARPEAALRAGLPVEGWTLPQPVEGGLARVPGWEGALDAALAALRLHPSAAAVQEHGCGALAALASAGAAAPERGWAAAAAAARCAARRHTGRAAVQARCVAALRGIEAWGASKPGGGGGEDDSEGGDGGRGSGSDACELE